MDKDEQKKYEALIEKDVRDGVWFLTGKISGTKYKIERESFTMDAFAASYRGVKQKEIISFDLFILREGEWENIESSKKRKDLIEFVGLGEVRADVERKEQERSQEYLKSRPCNCKAMKPGVKCFPCRARAKE